jgi:menaquinol-cytochrome c reductase iron-sulfur subunit
MNNSTSQCCCPNAPPLNGDNRRGFLGKAAAVVCGAVALLIPTAAGVAAFLNPLRQKGQGGRFLRMASLDVLPKDGMPMRVSAVAERTDAWTQFPPEEIGAVYLRRDGDKVAALQTLCPHAGCPVGFDQQKKVFACPCHSQPQFELSGKRVDGPKSFSPRDMDELDVEIRNTNEVWVKFQTFVAGKAEKVAQG